MGGDDANATFGFEPSLVLGSEQVVELLRILGVCGGEPPAYVRPARVSVGHGRIYMQQVDLRERQVPDVLDLLAAQIAPPKGRPRTMPLIKVRRLSEGEAIQQP